MVGQPALAVKPALATALLWQEAVHPQLAEAALALLWGVYITAPGMASTTWPQLGNTPFLLGEGSRAHTACWLRQRGCTRHCSAAGIGSGSAGVDSFPTQDLPGLGVGRQEGWRGSSMTAGCGCP